MEDEKKCLVCGLSKLPYPIKTKVGKQEIVMTVYYCPNYCGSLQERIVPTKIPSILNSFVS